MMDDFLDQIEVAVAKKSENQKKALKKQLERKKISQSTFTKKQGELEKWVTAERREINEKRSQRHLPRDRRVHGKDREG
jgi:hypothetical protein